MNEIRGKVLLHYGRRISNREQLSISFHYLRDDKFFLTLVKLKESGKVIADIILKSLNAWGLPLQNMRGQCYNGASYMAGARSGYSAIIQEVAPLALYHHCAAHRLNLAILSACKISAFRNIESYIGENVKIFSVF